MMFITYFEMLPKNKEGETERQKNEYNKMLTRKIYGISIGVFIGSFFLIFLEVSYFVIVKCWQ